MFGHTYIFILYGQIGEMYGHHSQYVALRGQIVKSWFLGLVQIVSLRSSHCCLLSQSLASFPLLIQS